MKYFSFARAGIVLTTLITPLSVFAARDLKGIIGIFTDLLNSLLPLVEGIAFLAFLWGLANFIWHADNEEKRSEGKQIMIWGIIALFVMVSAFPIVHIIQNTFFGGGGNAPAGVNPGDSCFELGVGC